MSLSDEHPPLVGRRLEIPLQDRDVRLVLRQAPPELADLDAQRDAHEDPVGRRVGDREDRPLDARRSRRPSPTSPRGTTPSRATPGARPAGRRGSRGRARRRRSRTRRRGTAACPGPAPSAARYAAVGLADLLVRPALPGAVVHLAQAGIGLDLDAAGDDRGRLAGAEQRAGEGAIERDGREAAGQGLGLAPAGLVDRDVDPLAEVLLGRRPIGQAVTGEHERQHRRQSRVRGWDNGWRKEAATRDDRRPRRAPDPRRARHVPRRRGQPRVRGRSRGRPRPRRPRPRGRGARPDRLADVGRRRPGRDRGADRDRRAGRRLGFSTATGSGWRGSRLPDRLGRGRVGRGYVGRRRLGVRSSIGSSVSHAECIGRSHHGVGAIVSFSRPRSTAS